MLKRICTGGLFVAVIVGFFFLRTIDLRLFAILILAMNAIGTYEMIKAFSDKLLLSQKILTMLFALAIIPVGTLCSVTFLAVVILIAVSIAFSLLVFQHSIITFENLGTNLICMLYPSLFLLAMAQVNIAVESSLIGLLLIFIISPFADTFAFFVGITFKGKKLCPNISPNKTISGAIGGLLGGIIASVSLYLILINTNNLVSISHGEVVTFIFIGVVCSIFTQFGDLVESIIKRKVGIKDMGKLLPGHGGVLDRIDGILFASVIIYLALTFISVSV